jgi:GTP-binding protein
MSAQFVDEVRVHARAGDGGAGALSFHREKHKPRGGPDGGDGGRGGSVVLVADAELASLAPYARRKLLRATNGGKGSGNHRNGRDGEDLIVSVPPGTIVRDASTGEMLADLARAGTRYVVTRGGRGGRGSAALRTRNDRVPNYAEPGEPGEQNEVILELHLVADIGLLGLPNAGKSTLLAAVSRATPKIADYPFTTLIPGLGVVDRGDNRFVIADLPGLIEGASQGKGLGLAFLRHAERCNVLALVVDVSTPAPDADLSSVLSEVETYDAALAARVRVVVGNKIDLDTANPEPARVWAERNGAHFAAVSAAQKTNLHELLGVLDEEVTRAQAELGERETFAVFRPVVEDPIEVSREGDAFRVRSSRAERIVAQASFDDQRAVRRLQQQLRSLGVEAALRRQGVQAGDEIRIGDGAFEYVPDEVVQKHA